MQTREIRQAAPAAVVEPAPRVGSGPPPAAGALVDEVVYPSCDGEPMADNTYQARTMFDAYCMLAEHFRGRPDVFVASDLLVYDERGNPGRRVAPDVMVVLGVADRHRMSYRVWEEGKPPDWVLEVASEGPAGRDLRTKPGRYARMGVPEYWQYDPQGGLMEPRLLGRRLAGGRYEDLPSVPAAGAEIAVASEALGLRVEFDGRRLRFWNPRERRYLLTPEETEAARRAAEESRLAAEQGRLAEERAWRAAEEGRLAAEQEGRAAQRKLLTMCARLRFGEPVARAVGERLAGLTDAGVLESVGEWIEASETPEALLARLAAA